MLTRPRLSSRPSRDARLPALLAALLVLLVALPLPVAGAEPPQRRFTPQDKGLSHDVYAFFLPSARDHLLQHADWSVLSTIAYFGVVARKGGNLARRTGGRVDSRWAAWDGAMMDRIIDKAHATGTNVVLSVTRFAWTAQGRRATERLLENPTARARLAREIAVEVERRDLDGINLDFEPIPSGQSANFVRLVRQVRDRLDRVRPGLDLTVATTGYIANYDVAALTAPGAADAIFIMAYHYNGSWSRRAGSIAPLRRRTYDVTDTVNAYLRHTTPDRIILGVPYYGYVWSTETADVHARARPLSARWGYPGSVTYQSAVRIAAEHGRRWDTIEQGPWVRWQHRACSDCPRTWRQLYYEDAQSLGRKYDLVKAKGLRGSGIWALGYEGRRRDLERALRNAYRAD